MTSITEWLASSAQMCWAWTFGRFSLAVHCMFCSYFYGDSFAVTSFVVPTDYWKQLHPCVQYLTTIVRGASHVDCLHEVSPSICWFCAACLVFRFGLCQSPGTFRPPDMWHVWFLTRWSMWWILVISLFNEPVFILMVSQAVEDITVNLLYTSFNEQMSINGGARSPDQRFLWSLRVGPPCIWRTPACYNFGYFWTRLFVRYV